MSAADPREDPEGIALVEGFLARLGGITIQPWQAQILSLACGLSTLKLACLHESRRQEDPTRYAAATEMARTTVWTFEACWQYLTPDSPIQELVAGFKQVPQRDPPNIVDKRSAALAARKRQGKGPPSSSSWRGRERNTKYRSQ